MADSSRILFLEKQRRLFIEAHAKGFTNKDIAKLIGASVGHVNNCASCSCTLLSGAQMDDFIRKCELRGYVRELAEDFGYVLLDRPATIKRKLQAEARAGLEELIKSAEEALNIINGEKEG